MHPTAATFAERLRDTHGLEPEIREFPEGTKTARDAADAIGCELAQIVKSIVMTVGDDVVVVLTSGANRVDETALAGSFDVAPDAVTSASPDAVKAATGGSIGGVPPVLHERTLPVLADPLLFEYDAVWAAAGTPSAVFRLTPAQLERLAAPEVVDVFE